MTALSRTRSARFCLPPAIRSRSPRTLASLGHKDEEHLEHAAQHGLIVLTKNPKDFVHLHNAWRTANRDHPGIFLVYQDNDVGRDMSDAEVVRAVANVEEVHGAGGLANQVFSLNQYRW